MVRQNCTFRRPSKSINPAVVSDPHEITNMGDLTTPSRRYKDMIIRFAQITPNGPFAIAHSCAQVRAAEFL